MYGRYVSMMFTLMLALIFLQVGAEADPLPSWNAGATKDAIIQYVNDVTTPGTNFIPPAERVATFDQDGTLWVEQPLYSQLFFAIDRLKVLAPQHPEWKDPQLLALLDGNLEEVKNLTESDIAKIVFETHAGMSVEAFRDIVRHWLKGAIHPKFKRPFTELVYQPMLEVIKLFKAKGFKVYIVSGGGQDFIRAYAEQVYGIPPEQILGSAAKVKYEYQEGRPELLKLPNILMIDDKQGKPEMINLVIGRRPVAAFGNSDGDRQMLEWTYAGTGKRFELLVHHDDAAREYAYGAQSKIGTFSDSLKAEAEKNGWTIVSMKNDWKVIFPWEKGTEK